MILRIDQPVVFPSHVQSEETQPLSRLETPGVLESWRGTPKLLTFYHNPVLLTSVLVIGNCSNSEAQNDIFLSRER